MRPDEKYTADLITEEQTRLSKKVKALSEQDKSEIAKDGKDLLASQDRQEDLSCLPSLQLSDIALKAKHTVLEHTGLCNTPVQWRTTSTNGITYFRAISSLPTLPDDLKMYLPLFCDSLLSLGTRQQSMAEIDDEIRLYTGGLRASTTLSTNHSDIDHIEEGIALVGNCLDRNIDKMYSILAKLIHETNFDDVEKLKTLINGVSFFFTCQKHRITFIYLFILERIIYGKLNCRFWTYFCTYFCRIQFNTWYAQCRIDGRYDTG